MLVKAKEIEVRYWPVLYILVSIAALIFLFSEALKYMMLDWEREEFSHGYMIPLVSIYLILQNIPRLSSLKSTHKSIGLLFVATGIFLYFMGELSAIYTIIQYGFVIAVIGVFVSLLGIQSLKVIGIPIVYLLFMIPLPNFLYFNLSSSLQLISSNIGVYFLRLLNISVFLEGNVIDLGNFKLQVVDACSGLRYLFPLMSFGFLVAYIYEASLWKRAVVFFSTLPITILMNSFRIAVIGITVDMWGISAAEGFLHDFQGWVVFMACLGLLALEIFILHRLSGGRGSPIDNISIGLPTPIFSYKYFSHIKNFQASAIITLFILIAVAPLKFVIADRDEVVPNRHELNQMPLIIDSWVGHESRFDKDVIDALKVKDYMVADYVDSNSATSVNLYIAYYDSQRKGASVHSPKTCMPGGGWEMKSLNELKLDDIRPYGTEKLVVNRAIIQKGNAKNLVYYWFQQRGRIVTNEYLAKWYIFFDSLTRNRTDGALVRVTVEYSDAQGVDSAEKQLQHFVKGVAPYLPQYIPE